MYRAASKLASSFGSSTSRKLAGDNVGLLLRGLKREDIQRGQVIAKPETLKTYKKFEAEIYVLTKEEGGRHTAFMSNYRPQFYMRTADITGKVELPKNVKMVMPGDNVTAAFELISPVSLEAGCLNLPQGDSVNVGREIVGSAWKALGAQGPCWGLARWSESVSVPHSTSCRCYVHYGSGPNADTGRNLKSMSFVRGILEEDGTDFMGSFQFPRPPNMEHNADIVHVKLMRNNTFITVTDNKGNTKLKASAGRLEELKGGPKLSRYAAEAIAEYVGRESRKLGLKSVVMRVKGFTYFKKKRQAIMSWRDGFTDSRSDQNPIVYIEDTTRRAHNGCRLPKQRRV